MQFRKSLQNLGPRFQKLAAFSRPKIPRRGKAMEASSLLSRAGRCKWE